MKLIIISFALLFFISISWAAIVFFKTDNPGAKKGKRYISIIGAFATLVALYDISNMADINYIIGCIAVIAFILALMLFWWTYKTVHSTTFSFAFSSDTPSHLVIIGPFKIIRHPFYTSYILGWLAAFIATNTIGTLLIFIAMFIIYWNAAKKEETNFLISPLAGEYLEYKSKTGKFLPVLF